MASPLSTTGLKGVSWDSFEKTASKNATEDKIYRLVLGKIIPAILLGIGITCAVLTFTASPFFVLGAITFLPASFVFYSILNFDLDLFDQTNSTMFNPSIPFVPSYQNGQPVGIRNPGNDCWANAAIQMIMHTASLRDRFQLVPNFAPIKSGYEEAINGQVSVANIPFGRLLRTELHTLSEGRAVSCGCSMEDPSTIFEYMLSGDRALYYYTQTVDGELSLEEPIEPFIRLMLDEGADFNQLFEAHFNYTEGYSRLINRRFETSPDCLLIQMPRFYQQNTENGELIFRKNSDPIQVPLQFTLQADKVMDRIERQYECTGFVVHHGSSIHGGHYVSYVKKDDVWWLCNDSDIRIVSQEDVAAAISQAYFICFNKV